MKKLLLMSVGLLIVAHGYGLPNTIETAIEKNNLVAFKAAVTPSTLQSQNTGNEILHSIIHSSVEPKIPSKFSDQMRAIANKHDDKWDKYINNLRHEMVASLLDSDEKQRKEARKQFEEQVGINNQKTQKQIKEEQIAYLKDHGADNNLCEWLSITRPPASNPQDAYRHKLTFFKKQGQTKCAMINYLKNLGVDLNARNKDGLSPLHEAVIIPTGGNVTVNTEIVSCLVGLGADVNAKTPTGDSSLEIVEQNGSLRSIKKILVKKLLEDAFKK